MAETVWQKLNLPESTTHIEMPLEFMGKKKGGESIFKELTGTAQILLAEIHTQQKLFKHPAKITYEYLNKKYGMSRGPVARALKELTDQKIIESVGQSRYKIIVEYNKKNHLKIDDYLFKHIFTVYDEQGNAVKLKRLTRSAIKQIALLQRHYNNPKTSDKFLSSQARIGAALNLPRTTAGDSIRELVSVSVFSCEKSEDDHGASKRGLYVYEVNPEIMAVKRGKEKASKPAAEDLEPTAADVVAAKELFNTGDVDYIQHTKPKKKKANKPTKSVIARWDKVMEELEAEQAQMTRAEVEQHFYDLRHAAEERADKARAQANADKEYNAIAKRLTELVQEIAFAELEDKDKAARLSEERLELERAGDERLAALGIDKAEFFPRYECSACNDTGYNSRGEPCGCLKKFINEIKI